MTALALLSANVFMAMNSMPAAVPGMLIGNPNLSEYHLGRSLHVKYPHMVKTSRGCLTKAPQVESGKCIRSKFLVFRRTSIEAPKILAIRPPTQSDIPSNAFLGRVTGANPRFG